jgi:hypothetical protein
MFPTGTVMQKGANSRGDLMERQGQRLPWGGDTLIDGDAAVEAVQVVEV